MKAPVKWLEEYAGIEVSMEELVEKLTLRGLEVEGIKKGKTGEVIEIELTPNRGDCASIYGIIREISAIYDIEYKEPETDYREINESIRDNFKLENRIPEKCPAYYLKYIKNVKVEDSPQWIKNRLRDCGIRPQNNVVDITNYVLMELGQPLHAFDASKIKNNKIIVRKGINQEKITTLDDKQANVNKEDIIIGDNEKAVAIGGVMGGKDTCVTESTTDILLESAFFKPESISETEKRLNIKSESSYRFARHIDEKGIKRGLDRAAHLIQKICSGEPTRDELCFDNTKDEFKKIYLQKKKIKNILGIEIKDKEIKNNMERLNFKVEDNGSEVKFSVPSYRNDVTRDIDIIEEIARMHGYENIEPTLPESKIDTRFINKPDIYKISEEILKSFNYWQIVTPTIINSKTPITDNERRNCVELSNPVN
ncbi:MAG: phenylalanine--tRNA ligase subunit beta, partial [Elusimicrobiota bacterium]